MLDSSDVTQGYAFLKNAFALALVVAAAFKLSGCISSALALPSTWPIYQFIKSCEIIFCSAKHESNLKIIK